MTFSVTSDPGRLVKCVGRGKGRRRHNLKQKLTLHSDNKKRKAYSYRYTAQRAIDITSGRVWQCVSWKYVLATAAVQRWQRTAIFCAESSFLSYSSWFVLMMSTD